MGKPFDPDRIPTVFDPYRASAAALRLREGKPAKPLCEVILHSKGLVISTILKGGRMADATALSSLRDQAEFHRLGRSGFNRISQGGAA